MMWSAIPAFVRRDLSSAATYKVALLNQLVTLLSAVLTTWFLARMIATGNVAALAPWGGDYFTFAVIGVAFADYLRVSISGFSQSLRVAQRQGTLEAMLATPASPLTIVIGNASWRFVLSFVRVGLYLVAGAALGASFANANGLGVLATLALSAPAFAAVGLLGASFILVLKQWEPITPLFAGLSVLLSGVLYPVASLPEFAQSLAWFLPMTHALDAVRSALLLGRGPAELWQQLSILIGFTALVLPLSLWTFRRALHHVRVDGSTSHY